MTLPTKIHMIKAMLFPGVMYRYKSWTIKEAENQRIDAFKLCCWRSLLRVPWPARINLKGNQPRIFIARTIAEAEAPILWPPDAKSWLTGKDPDCWEILKAKGKEGAEDEVIRYHDQLNGHEFEQTPGDIERQWCLICSSPLGHK